MSLDPASKTDDRSYGEVLGEYFSVAAAISRTLDEFGRPRESQRAEYEHWCARKRELRSLLAEMEQDSSRSEIEEQLERAFSSE